MDFVSAFLSLPKIYLLLLVILASALSGELIYIAGKLRHPKSTTNTTQFPTIKVPVNNTETAVKPEVVSPELTTIPAPPNYSSLPNASDVKPSPSLKAKIKLQLVMIGIGVLIILGVIPLSKLVLFPRSETSQKVSNNLSNLPEITPIETTACSSLKFYTDTNSWIGIPVEELSNLKVGDKIAITVVGTTDTDKARIRVNGSSWHELTQKRLVPNVIEFYDNQYLYEIPLPPGKPTFTVEAELHDKSGWH